MSKIEFGEWVEIAFDCLPLRTVTRTDVPLDASPGLAAKMLRVKAAIEKHGTLNTYFLHNASCSFHFTNDPREGMVQFAFQGVVLTDPADLSARSCELEIALERETCEWLDQSIVDWLKASVKVAVLVEFNRYIAAGDLRKAQERIEKIQKASDQVGGYVGMYL